MRVLPDRRLREIERLCAERSSAFVRVARAIVGDRGRALEAVHDGFEDAIGSRRSFRGEGPLEAWVWRAVVDAARRAARRPLVERGFVIDEEAELAPALPELTPLLALLPERQRLVVFLRYYADLDYRSIAAALGLEIDTVGDSLATAHRVVRRACEEIEARD